MNTARRDAVNAACPSSPPTRKRQATANTWAHAREPQDAEPARCPHKDEKIYYSHGIELSAPDHPIKRQRDNLIQDAFAKAGEVNASKQSARQEAALRAAVNRKAALEALIQLVTVRNLSCNCSSWPELHALICAVNYTAQDLISLSHGSIQKLVSIPTVCTRRETRDKHDSGWCSTWFFVKWGALAPVKPSVMLAELHERLGAYMFDYYAVISVRPEAPPLYDILVRVEARTGSGDVRRLLSLEGSTVFDPGVSCVWKVTCCQAALETDVGFMLKHFEPGPDRFFFGNEILADKLKLDVHAALA
ncbi:hypothetical protein MY1884_002000 [Beauveria asiatica]